MKVLSYILVLSLLTLGACTSSLYTGAEYDDLYYSASDKPIVKARKSVNDRIQSEDYYDNIYAADTLVSDQYSDAVNYNNAPIDNNNNYGSGYSYDDNYSYSGRLRRFYGNYFDPYWRYSFYFDFGYPSFGYSFGYGGFPYYYNPYSWNPYGYGGLYGDYLGGYYGGGFNGGYYGGFNSFYSPFYGMYGNYFGSYIHNEGKNSISYGRRERPSTLSSKWNSNATATGSTRRDPNVSSGGNSGIARRITSGSQGVAADQRRPYSTSTNGQLAGNATDRRLNQSQDKGENINTDATTRRSAASVRPEYNTTNRTYTPSYSNPRMSTRPSYNNSRVSDGSNSGVNRNDGAVNNSRVYNNTGAGRGSSNQNYYRNPENNVRSNSPSNSVQRRTISPSNNSVQYSAPTRRSAESSSGNSSGSYNNSYSGGRSSSSYSSGSSSSYSSGSSGSGRSYSSGSSSGSTSGSSSRRR